MSEDIKKQIEELNKQVDELRKQGKYNDALPIAQQACDLAKEHLGEEHPDYATSLNSLGILHYFMGNYPSAEIYYKQAMEIKRKALGEEHPDFAKSLNNLGLLYRIIGNYTLSEAFQKQALEIKRKAFGEENQGIAISLSSLGTLYWYMGNYSSAESNLKQAMEIWRKVLGEEHPDFARSLINLGLLYRDMGNYSSAESCYKQAMEVLRKALGEKHPDFAKSLNNLGLLYFDMGNYSSAESYNKQAMETWREALGNEHPEFAMSLNNLGTLYHKISNYTEAESYLKHAMEIRRKSLGEEHPDFARSLNNLGSLYSDMGNYSSAESYLTQAMEIFRKVLGDEHPDFAISLTSLGILYDNMGDYEMSDSLLKQAMAIRLKVLGENHPDVADSLVELAKLYPAIDRNNEAYAYINKASEVYNYLISQIFSFGSETQRMDYLKKIQPSFDVHLSLVYKQFNESIEKIQSTLDLVLRRKAISAEALAAQRDAVLGGKYPELSEKLKELTMLHMQIALKTIKGPGPEGREMHDKMISEWTENKDKLESVLVRQIPEMNLVDKLRQTDRIAVANSLPDNSVLVEFVKFNEFDFKAVPAKGEKHWKPSRYLAFVLSAGKPDEVRMIDLGEAEPIDKLISDLRSSITGESELKCRSPYKTEVYPVIAYKSGSELREAVFDKLSEPLAGYTRIYISPDGDLCKLPFEILPSKGGKYLIDDYQISYLSVGRDVLRFSAESNVIPEDSIVAADPDFDMGSVVKHKKPEKVGSVVRGWRQSRDFNSSMMKFDRLPGTRPESDKVSAILNIKPMLEKKVLEGKLKSIHSPFILHLATHGFFLEDQKVELGKETGPKYENPLLRSGLALAGANTALKGGVLPDDAEDGILTAEDVSGLDLMGTELVVLSACETGLGEIRTGEGVFGLRRAFMLAGAKTLVMSLWKVTDLATPILMERFYENLLNKGLDRDESLREAQMFLRGLTIKEIRNLLTDDVINRIADGNDKIKQEIDQFLLLDDDTTPFADPLFWGAFICQGVTHPIRKRIQ
jgi:CHAT domain-containing protein/tetratricopeptide (TPR) repeat protein